MERSLRTSRSLRRLSVLLLIFLPSCGASNSPEAMLAQPSTSYPAPHPPMPVVVSSGGSAMKAPHLVPVFFENDPYQADLERLIASLGPSDFWAATTAEYGVGPATSGPSIRRTDQPPTMADIVDIRAWLASQLDGTHPDWATPDENTLYVLFYPANTVVTWQGLAQGPRCGMHDEVALPNGRSAIFTVQSEISECPAVKELNIHGLDQMTVFTGHELIEAATDPHLRTAPAFFGADLDHVVWWIFYGLEVGDLCEFNQDVLYRPPSLDGYLVQRSWSNVQARASHDPCAPAPGGVYFNSAPVLDDAITINVFGRTYPTKGVKIPIGQSRTVDVDLYSDGPTNGAWTVSAIDAAAERGEAPALSFAFDRPSGLNGDVLHLTITVQRADSTHGAEAFTLVSTLGQRTNRWFGAVGN